MTARILLTDIECIDHGLKGNPEGYARTWVRGEGHKMLTHRKVFLDAHGYLPPVVMHTCDNTRCINVGHLAPGDWGANNRDRATKGRSSKVRTDLRRLTQEQADEIRSRFPGRGHRDPVNGSSALAREFGVTSKAIYQIVDRKVYFA